MSFSSFPWTHTTMPQAPTQPPPQHWPVQWGSLIRTWCTCSPWALEGTTTPAPGSTAGLSPTGGTTLLDQQPAEDWPHRCKRQKGPFWRTSHHQARPACSSSTSTWRSTTMSLGQSLRRPRRRGVLCIQSSSNSSSRDKTLQPQPTAGIFPVVWTAPAAHRAAATAAPGTTTGATTTNNNSSQYLQSVVAPSIRGPGPTPSSLRRSLLPG